MFANKRQSSAAKSGLIKQVVYGVFGALVAYPICLWLHHLVYHTQRTASPVVIPAAVRTTTEGTWELNDSTGRLIWVPRDVPEPESVTEPEIDVVVPKSDDIWIFDKHAKRRAKQGEKVVTTGYTVAPEPDKSRAKRKNTALSKQPQGPARSDASRRTMEITDHSEQVYGCAHGNITWSTTCAGHDSGTLVQRGSEAGKQGPYVAFVPPVEFQNKRKRSAHAASLIVLPEGDVAVTWFSGEEGTSGVLIAFALLQYNSWSWEKPRVVNWDRRKSYQNPVMYYDAQLQVLTLLHTAQAAWRGQFQSHIMALKTKDVGQTWSDPKEIISRAGSFCRHPPVRTSDGSEWLLPMYYTPGSRTERGPTGAAQKKLHYSAMRRSTTDRRGNSAWIANTEAKMSQGGQFLVQPSVVRLRSHRLVASLPSPPNTTAAALPLLALFRDRRATAVYRSISLDDGKTWSRPEKTMLPNNNSALQLALLASGRLCVVFNNVALAKDRFPLSIALSDDDGLTWRYVRDLEATGEGGTPPDEKKKSLGKYAHEYSYPSLVQTPDEMIHVAYTWRRVLVKHVVVSEPWIMSDAALPSKGVLKGHGQGTSGVHDLGASAVASVAGNTASGAEEKAESSASVERDSVGDDYGGSSSGDTVDGDGGEDVVGWASGDSEESAETPVEKSEQSDEADADMGEGSDVAIAEASWVHSNVAVDAGSMDAIDAGYALEDAGVADASAVSAEGVDAGGLEGAEGVDVAEDATEGSVETFVDAAEMADAAGAELLSVEGSDLVDADTGGSLEITDTRDTEDASGPDVIETGLQATLAGDTAVADPDASTPVYEVGDDTEIEDVQVAGGEV